MQELRPKDFCTDEDLQSGEQNVPDNGGQSKMEEKETQVGQPRLVEEMAEDIRRIPPHYRTEVL